MKKLAVFAFALLLSGFATFGADISQATETTDTTTATAAASLPSIYTGTDEAELVAPTCRWVLIGGVWYYICT